MPVSVVLLGDARPTDHGRLVIRVVVFLDMRSRSAVEMLSAGEADEVVFEILGGETGRADPYPLYRRLREGRAVHCSPSTGVWFVSDYGVAKHVLHDPRFGRGNGSMMGAMADAEVAVRSGEMRRASRNMLFADPPDHTRLRGLVSRAFTPRRVEELRPRLVELVDPLFDAAGGGQDVDLLDAVAFRFPVAVIGELVGVPEEDRDQFRTLVRASTAMIEAAPSAEALADAQRSMGEMSEYFHDLVARRRRRPSGDLLSAMIAIEDADGDRLTEDELVSTAILLFGAGFETTTNLIGNGTLCLLRHPDQLARLRADPSLLLTAVEEMLRFESPVQLDARTALVDAEVDGHPVEAGTSVVTFLGAANRDPQVFTEPDVFDVGRSPNNPLSFGWGIHHCLGAHLARLEGEVVFGRMLERFARIELIEEPTWRQSITLRGLEGLRVTAVTDPELTS
ncbi:cytochrome P450 [Iamia sp. SCSIO 61187]|uniref:cytochrome P450 n=1 Tax=Iamia sp. SCSIO 61187 TaxID=2722752 RepID=UPI001C631540|nr:cytochrome P450 [Iamia sp. SCSIO 61187]QYG94415.1 cytochrome P450 [Iamia sp. SCSIO 61187]